jgi:hypothetical protein
VKREAAGRLQLFDMSVDANERHDIAAQKPETAEVDGWPRQERHERIQRSDGRAQESASA